MKRISIIILSAIVAGFIGSNKSEAQPSVSQKYNNAQIDKLVDEFQSKGPKSVWPPAIVQTNLAQDFKGVQEVEWEGASGLYQVDFMVNNSKMHAYYDAEGNLLAYSVNMKKSELPALVQRSLASDYQEYKVLDADKVTRGTETFYKLELGLNEKEIKVLLKDDGAFVSRWRN